MDEPLIDSAMADEQRAAADLMDSKPGGGDQADDRGGAAPRDEVDRSTLLTTVNAGSVTPGAPVAGTPLPYEFTEAEYARTASVQRAERDAGLAADADRESLTYATPGEELADDSRRARDRRGQESEQRDANRIERSGEDEAIDVIDGAEGTVEGGTRGAGDDGEVVAATAEGAPAAVAGAAGAVGEAPAPLAAALGLAPLGPGPLGLAPLGPDRLGERTFGRDRFEENPDDLLARIIGDEPAKPPPNFADAPLLKSTFTSGLEDTAIGLDIEASLTDPSEKLSITIAGVPPGATLSAGTDNGDGTWSLTQADLVGLTITPPLNSDADFTLSVTATSTSEIDSARTARLINVEVDPSADTPTVTTADVSGNEDTAIALDITSALSDTDGSESLSVVVSGVPSGATLSAGIDNGNGTWTLTQAQLTGLTLTPPGDADADFTLTVTATSTDGADTDRTVDTFDVTVNAAADTPTVTTADVSGDEDTAIALDITAALSDTDGSESLSVVVSGVPSGATLSAGIDNGGGVWVLGPAQLSGLTVTPAPGSDTDFTLTVTATSRDGGDTANTVDTFDVIVTAVADAPVLRVADAAGAEDVAIALDITSALSDNDGSESLSITISGVPAGATLSAGTDTGGGVWVLGPAQLSGLTVTPAPGSDTDFTLTVTATSRDGDDTARNVDTLTVTVDDDAIVGGAGDDVLRGTNKSDTILGLGGDDTITGGKGADVLRGGDGDDTFLLGGGSGGKDVDQFFGGAGFDTILGGSGKNTINVTDNLANLDGIERIDGGAGDDKIKGTKGDDTLDFSAGPELVGIELIDGGSGNDTIIGTSGNDTITGGKGDDVLRGGAGDDTFLVGGGKQGADQFFGGDGFDTILGGSGKNTFDVTDNLANLDGIERIDGGSGNDKIKGTKGDDRLDFSSGPELVGIELIDGGRGNDTITGTSGDDTIKGGKGDDVLRGGAGDDVLRGGDGNDVFIGGAGSDTADGGKGADTFLLLEASGQNIFRGGGGDWIDVIDVQGANGEDPGIGWDFVVTDGSVISQIDGVIKLSKESSGTISLDDGTTLSFSGVEELTF